MPAPDPEALQQTYLQSMASYRLPPLVVASRAGPGAPICRDGARDIHHDHWLLHDPKLRRQQEGFWITFDGVVGSSGQRLNAPERRADYLVKKTLVLLALGKGVGRKNSGAQQIRTEARRYDWFVRDRLDLGVESNEDLLPEHFEELCGKMASGDKAGAGRMSDRLDLLFSQFSRGTLEFGDLVFTDARRSKIPLFSWPILAEQLGTTRNSIANSKSFLTDLQDRISTLNHPLAKSAAEALRAKKPPPEKQEKRARRTVENELMIWNKLYKLSRSQELAAGRILFNPFAKLSLKQIARRVDARQGERTKTLPPEAFMRLLREASRWVFEYGDYILDALRAKRAKQYDNNKGAFYERFDRLMPVGAPKLEYRFFKEMLGGEADGSRLSLGDAVRHLMTGCAIIIACFTARRGGEIEMLSSDCIVLREGLTYMKVYIEKTLKAIDQIPVPEMVVEAVDVLRQMASSEHGDAPYELFEVLAKKQVLRFHFTESLKLFTKFARIEPPQGEEEWSFASHQFRRGFAVFYYYGNDWAMLDPLSHMLRHFDPEQTRIYITEAVAGAIIGLQDELRARSEAAKASTSSETKEWIKATKERLSDLRAIVGEFSEVRVEAYVYRMMSLYKHTDNVIGFGARRLYADLEAAVEAATADVRITSAANDNEAFETALTTRLREHAYRKFLEPVPGGVSHCNANAEEDDLSAAQCNKLAAAGVAPWTGGIFRAAQQVDLAFSGAYPCLTCIYGCQFSANQKVVDRKIESLQASVDGAPGDNARRGRQAQFERLVLARRAAEAASKSA